MPIVNGVITAGPRLSADIATALGVSNTNQSYLCGNLHGKTRWWAKFKPTIFAMDAARSGALGSTLLKNANGFAYWQGMFGDCGLVPLSFQSYALAINYASGGVNGWKYLAPTGGAAAPHRDGDFIGYKQEGRQGIGTVSIQGSSMAVGDTGVTVYFSAYPTADYDLGFADIATIKDCKFGVYLTRNNGASGTYVINPAKITDTNTSYVLLSGKSEGKPQPETVTGSEQTGTSNALVAGTYKIYPFLFKEGVYYSIPYANVLTLEVKSAESTAPYVTGNFSNFNGLNGTLTITVWRAAKNQSIQYSATFYNKSTTVINSRGVAADPQVSLGEALVASGTGTADADGVMQVTLTKIRPDDILVNDGRWQLLVTANVGGTTYTQVSEVIPVW